MAISVVEHCDTYNGGPMLSPPPRLQLSTSWAGGVPQRSLPAPPRPNPHGAVPHHPSLGPSACGELPPGPIRRRHQVLRTVATGVYLNSERRLWTMCPIACG
jgi:hypothetical protein